MVDFNEFMEQAKENQSKDGLTDKLKGIAKGISGFTSSIGKDKEQIEDTHFEKKVAPHISASQREDIRERYSLENLDTELGKKEDRLRHEAQNEYRKAEREKFKTDAETRRLNFELNKQKIDAQRRINEEIQRRKLAQIRNAKMEAEENRIEAEYESLERQQNLEALKGELYRQKMQTVKSQIENNPITVVSNEIKRVAPNISVQNAIDSTGVNQMLAPRYSEEQAFYYLRNYLSNQLLSDEQKERAIVTFLQSQPHLTEEQKERIFNALLPEESQEQEQSPQQAPQQQPRPQPQQRPQQRPQQTYPQSSQGVRRRVIIEEYGTPSGNYQQPRRGGFAPAFEGGMGQSVSNQPDQLIGGMGQSPRVPQAYGQQRRPAPPDQIFGGGAVNIPKVAFEGKMRVNTNPVQMRDIRTNDVRTNFNVHTREARLPRANIPDVNTRDFRSPTPRLPRAHIPNFHLD